MINKKGGLGLILTLLLFSSASLVCAEIRLEINKTLIDDVIIKEFNNKAYFNFSIKNQGNSDSFEIYSLVGVDMFPKEPFVIGSGETRNITVEVEALESAKRVDGYYTFVYKIKGKNSGTLEDKLTIRIVNLKEVFEISVDSINPNSSQATIYLTNKENTQVNNLEAEFSSVFFSSKETFSIAPYEKKSFTASLNSEKLATLTAGPYLVSAKVSRGNVSEDYESTIKFLEKSGLSTKETREGFVVSRYEIEKTNEGNVVTLAEITLSENIISRLFTTFNLDPLKVERRGLVVYYSWQKELRPAESLSVVARTNWLFPIIIIVAIIIIIILIRKYLVSDVILKKRLNLLRAKGGELALKISINAKARRFSEKISVIDKLPQMFKLYDRFGTITPTRVDEKNRRIEWNIESLNQGEEIVLSYIIYSKIGVVGRFEIPAAKAVYEREGKIKEASSNRVYYVSEPRKHED